MDLSEIKIEMDIFGVLRKADMIYFFVRYQVTPNPIAAPGYPPQSARSNKRKTQHKMNSKHH